MPRRFISTRRPSRYYVTGQITGSHIPWSQILLGLIVAIIGLFLMVYNWNDTAPYLKISGHVTNEYEHLINDGLGNMEYDSNWLKIDSDKNIYVFDKRIFQPVVSDKSFFKGQKIDLYVTDDDPPNVAAIQLYDQFGVPSIKYVTPPYKQNPNTYSTGSLSPMVGLVIMIIGLLVMAYNYWKYRLARKRLLAEEAAQSVSSTLSLPIAWDSNIPPRGPTYGPAYESPKKSLPPQE
jgi:hypothetical protein